jgi:hypothetical protein
MPISTCSQCTHLFETLSEEYANEPDRLCPSCARASSPYPPYSSSAEALKLEQKRRAISFRPSGGFLDPTCVDVQKDGLELGRDGATTFEEFTAEQLEKIAEAHRLPYDVIEHDIRAAYASAAVVDLAAARRARRR